ncbi:MAG TPA: hypothetical protein PKV50_07930 [Prolixibacteraceae bacterium]|nr:hypothetical protein [Prolixibacteraceae bacterium]
MSFILTSVISSFRVILTLVVFIFLLRWIFGLFSTGKQDSVNENHVYTKESGDTQIIIEKRVAKKVDKTEGEYVEYEEIDGEK